mgnify:CR=1 FL=1
MLSGTNGRLLRLSLQAAANGLVRNRLATVAATVTMTLMLLVLASVLVIRAGLDAALAYADSKVEVVAYLKLDATEAIADRLSAEIRGIDGVREIRFVSAEEALKEFRQRLVDRIIDNLFNQDIRTVILVRSIPDAPDVHAGAQVHAERRVGVMVKRAECCHLLR